MDFPTWVEREGHGALSRIQRESGVAYTTVHRAARGIPLRLPAAKLISEATNGEVPVEALLLGTTARARTAGHRDSVRPARAARQ